MIQGIATGPVLLERRGAVGYLTLNRPDAGNAIDPGLARALFDAVVAVEDDAQVRCVVVRGAGRMFCAGGDVKHLRAAGGSLPDLLDETLRYLHPAIAKLAAIGKPVVTAIPGPTAGAGVGLAAVGDIALAEPGAHFTLAYSRIGLSPDGGATWLLPRLIGLRRTQELALTNRRVAADEAAAIGLITRVVAEGTLESEVSVLAEELAASATGALGRAKRLLLANTGADLVAQLDAECGQIVEQGRSFEVQEGLAAFAERRKPDFRGSAP